MIVVRPLHPDLARHDAMGLATDAELAAVSAVGSAAIPLAQRGAANGVATLDATAKIPGAQLPALAIHDTFTVATPAAMLALVAQRGDMAIRTDLNPAGFFLLTSDIPANQSDWVQITAPGSVVSVNTRTGAVTGLAEQSAVGAEAAARAAADTTLTTNVAANATAIAAKQPIIPAGTYLGSADALALPILTRRGVADCARSAALQRVDYDDTAQWSETWANLTAWNAQSGQVSGGRLYSVAAPPYPAGVVRGIPGLAAAAVLAVGQKARLIGTITTPGGSAAASVWLGFDSQGAGVASGGVTTAAGIGLASGVPSTFTFNTTAAIPGAAALAAGTYDVTVTIDAEWISFTLSHPGHVWEYVAKLARPAPGTYLGSVTAALSDVRGLAGYSVGPLQVRAGVATSSPRTVEGTASRTVYTGAPTQAIAFGGANQSLRIQTPANYDSRVPTPVCFTVHGAGGTAKTPGQVVDPGGAYVQAIVNAGYIMAGCDADGDAWGNRVSLDDYAVLYRYLRDNFNIGPIVLSGGSMGCLASLNILSERVIPNIVAVALTSPVISLDAIHLIYELSVNTAYGTPALGPLPAAAAGYNPINKPGTAFRGVPMRFYASYGDNTAVRVTNTDPFAALVAPYSPEAAIVTTTGDHGDPSQFATADILAFFKRSIAGTGA